MRKNDTTGLRGRRTLGVAAASVAVLAVAGVTATQAFAASGHHRSGVRAATSSVATVKHTAKHTAKQVIRSRPVLDTTNSTVLKPPSSASGAATTAKSVHNTPRYITVSATKKNATQPYDGPTVNGLQAFQTAAAEVLPGATISDLSGMSGEKEGGKGGLDLTPADGTKSSPVQVTYFNAPAGDKASFQDCDNQFNCDILTLPDGSPMQVFDVPFAPGRANLSVARLVNGVEVGVWVGVPAGGDHPVVTRQQLVDLLSQPVWGALDHNH
jgi:hypothetical protein